MSLQVAGLTGLTDAEILAATVRAAADERAATVHLIALFAELDTRRLYLEQGCSSLFTFCTRVLQLSEHAAYGRIEAARCTRRIPAILDLLAEGAVTLTSIGLIAPHLTPENSGERLAAVRHKSKRDVEQLVAAWRPLPPVPSSVRKLPGPAIHRATPVPARGTDGDRGSGVLDGPDDRAATALPDRLRSELPAPPSQSLPRPSLVRPLAPGRYKVQFTVSEETYDRLRRAQELLRPVVPNGDPAAIFERALTMLVADLERTRCAAAARPRPGRDASQVDGTCQQQSSGGSGRATRDSAPSSVLRDAALSAAPQSAPYRAVRRRPDRRGQPCAPLTHTTSMRPSSGSGRGRCESFGPGYGATRSGPELKALHRDAGR